MLVLRHINFVRFMEWESDSSLLVNRERDAPTTIVYLSEFIWWNTSPSQENPTTKHENAL